MKIAFHYITIIAMFICITLAATYFCKASLLWWYIAPVIIQLMADTTQKERE